MDFSSLLQNMPDLGQLQAMRDGMQERLATVIVEADAGGGAVSVRMNARKELLKLTIAPAAATLAAGDVTLLEDLVTAAFNQALAKADAAAVSATLNLLPGMNLEQDLGL